MVLTLLAATASGVVRASPEPSPSPEASRSPDPDMAAPSPAPSVEAEVAPTPVYRSTVASTPKAPSRGGGDYQVEVGALNAVPRAGAADFMKLAPGILLTNEGGQAHAEQIFLRGFDAREGQDIELTVGGVPINESGNLHGNGYADLHFILPELVRSVRVVEGPYDPRQGNYAVAGSADFELGLAERGITAAFSYGSFNTKRLVLLWGPGSSSDQTFVGAELYQTDGFGQNRDGERGSLIAQYAGRSGTLAYRITAQAYIAPAFIPPASFAKTITKPGASAFTIPTIPGRAKTPRAIRWLRRSIRVTAPCTCRIRSISSRARSTSAKTSPGFYSTPKRRFKRRICSAAI